MPFHLNTVNSSACCIGWVVSVLDDMERVAISLSGIVGENGNGVHCDVNRVTLLSMGCLP